MRRRLVPLACLIGIAFLSPEPAGAQGSASPVTLELQPSSVTAQVSDKDVETRVVVRNSGQASISGGTLTAFANGGFKLDAGLPKVFALQRGDSAAWTVRILLGGAHLPGSVPFELTYRTAGQPGTARVYQTLQISAATPATTDKPLEVTVKGSFGAISESRSGRGYLVFSSALDAPITIAAVTITPDDGSLKTPAPITMFTIPGQSMETREVVLEASDKMTPGTHAVRFDIDAAWERAGGPQTRHLVVSQDVTVGVFFESEVLKALGVPSFLLLPGCLFLFTMQLLLDFGVLGADRYSKPPKLPVTEPGFWIIAVTFSSLFAFAYARIAHTDYLVRYGAADLRNVWLWSIAIGAVVYLAIAGITKRQRELKVPSSSDSPLTTLTKMGRRSAPVKAPKITFKINDVERTGFAIELIEDGQEMLWVAPPIVVTWTADPKALKSQEIVLRLIDKGEPAAAVATALTAAVSQNDATIAWDVREGVTTPYHVKVASITKYGAAESIVSVV